MLYDARVRLGKSSLGHRGARRLHEYRSGVPRARATADYMKGRVEGRSVADIGCMWNINGGHSFLAEDLGASRVVAVDLTKTREFEESVASRHSNVEFVQADATEPGILARLVGPVDVVWCFGVLYHVPDPLQLLSNLRDVCEGELILETFTIPEVAGIPQAACFFPYLAEPSRRVWRDRARPEGLSISKPFEEATGFANNYWGMAPSAVRAVLRTSGFTVEHHEPSLHGALRTVFFAKPVHRSGSPT